MVEFPQNSDVAPVTEAVSIGTVHGSPEGLGSGEARWGDAGVTEASGDLNETME
ncbi:hypothetical protein MA16_Dca003478 [Dendrobium catenatum]|uniref:Uncharacterized protein n=1 Tax=Dendrobium catenatum TaxID=906689 RepID=A0A2I0WF42_9ASPA|nr:hypothetical protein MA16_Dca003478 [Dendrobium catenatum]